MREFIEKTAGRIAESERNRADEPPVPVDDLRPWGFRHFVYLAGAFLIVPLYRILKPLGQRMGVWLVVALLVLAVCVAVATSIYSRRKKERAQRDEYERKRY